MHPIPVLHCAKRYPITLDISTEMWILDDQISAVHAELRRGPLFLHLGDMSNVYYLDAIGPYTPLSLQLHRVSLGTDL